MSLNDDEFDIHLSRSRPRRGKTQRGFTARVLHSLGTHSFRLQTRRAGAAQGRGQVAARIASRHLNNNSRRVVVKIRLVRLKQAGLRSTDVHLRYIERDGVGVRGESGHAYSRESDHVDLDAFAERGADDRHQFRIIVAPEDGVALADLKTYTRQLMRQVEIDLGTRTDWIAVDHWNTDNPHTHIVLRGKDQNGRDLVIAREYIARGFRERAGELATTWLGPRTEREIQTSLQRDVMQERWTPLDRTLQRLQDNGHIQLIVHPSLHPSHDNLLRARLQTLSTLGLAVPIHTNTWQLQPQWESTLRQLGERGDIIRTLQRAMGNRQREFAIFENASQDHKVIGSVIAKGLVDELSDRGYLALDGIDGRAHYVRISSHRLDNYPIGAIVEAKSGIRAIDTAIANESHAGIFRATTIIDSTISMEAKVRRLEVLRRAGIVERLTDSNWRIPSDLPELGRAFDVRQSGGIALKIHSHLSLEQQARAIGATWLDQQLVTQQFVLSHRSFGALVYDALNKREEFLVEQGLAMRKGQRIVLARDLLSTLRERELTDTAKFIEKEIGLHYRPIEDCKPIRGIYRRSLQLASGRFALLDNGNGFSLVPWRPVIEKHLGKSLSSTIDGQRVSWEIGRPRDISL
jgi:type IV secretory pathway VirD2 relaxase